MSGYSASLDQVDDFEDNGLAGWGGNMLGTVENVPGGGPDGEDDGFLKVDVNGFHLGTANKAQWTGDYLTAGIGAIEMDLKNLDLARHDLELRILVFGPGGTFASKTLTQPISTEGWETVTFGLTDQDLVHVQDGTGRLDDTLQEVSSLLIRHDRPSPTPPRQHPPHISGSLGIDNIRALPHKPQVSLLVVENASATLRLTDLIPGKTYGLQSTHGLPEGSWEEVTNILAISTSTNLTVSTPEDSAFFRLLVVE